MSYVEVKRANTRFAPTGFDVHLPAESRQYNQIMAKVAVGRGVHSLAYLSLMNAFERRRDFLNVSKGENGSKYACQCNVNETFFVANVFILCTRVPVRVLVAGAFRCVLKIRAWQRGY